MARETEAVLRYWQLLELLTSGTVPDSTSGEHGRVVDLTVDESPPWAAEAALCPSPEGREWRFRVYGGVFEVDEVHRALVERFGDAQAAFRTLRPQRQRSALFVLDLDEDGRLRPASTQLSQCAWVTGALLSGGRLELDAFDREQESFVRQLDRLADPAVAGPTGAERPPRRGAGARAADHLREAASEALAQGARSTGEMAGAFARTASLAAAGPVVGQLVGGVLGPVAATFVEKVLSSPQRGEGAASTRAPGPVRLDVRSLTALVEDLVEAMALTTPRVCGLRVETLSVVPGDERPAFLNGVFAADLGEVRQAVRRRGPPHALGRYLSAGRPDAYEERIDVQRAPGEVLRRVEPRCAPLGRWPGPPTRPPVLSQQLAVNETVSQLRDAGGLLAINGPPGTGKTTLLREVIAAAVVDRAGRLARLARPADAFDAEQVRVDFTEGRFVRLRRPRADLVGQEIVLATSTNAAAANVSREIPAASAVDMTALADVDHFQDLATTVLGAPAWGLIAAQLGNTTLRQGFAKAFWRGDEGMKELLTRAKQSPPSAEAWRLVVGRFEDAVGQVERLTTERQFVADALRRLPDLEARADESCAELTQLEERLREALALRETTAARRDQAEVRAEAAEHRTREQRAPRFTALLWTSWSRWSEQRREAHELRRRAVDRLRDRDEQREAAARAAVATAELEGAVGRARVAYEHLRRAADETEATVRAARRRWGRAVPGLADPDAAELCTPWADSEMVQARTAVFVAALDVHRSFVLGAARFLRRSLSVVVDLLEGKTVLAGPHARLVAWQSFFLVVPVVSTTFASLPTLFVGVGREQLGWLLVDEAGQSQPRDVVGGLFRARRALLVGDPRQLEPVAKLPREVVEALADRYRVPRRWTTPGSAQDVADEVTSLGTTLPDPTGGAPEWVGMPLRVHRRCDRSVFDIFSRMAYGADLLVLGTPPRQPLPRDGGWVHVPTRHGRGKWSDDEGMALLDLLRGLWREQGALESVAVLTPFKDIDDRIAAMEPLARHLEHRGTVYTMQGREADTVVIVLGTGTEEEGARRWLTGRPNQLNVAVSRARRRLFVIGDRDIWSHCPHMDHIAASMPVIEPPEAVRA